jgi:hypothetical protein
MMISKDANDTAADFIKRKIRSIVKDRATAAILSDIDHPYAAKSPPIDTESVYDHRSGQPVRAVQHASGD